MTKLPHDRLAAFGLGVMTTVLLLAPSAKAACYGNYDCVLQESQLRQLEQRQNQMKYQLERQEREIQNQRRGGNLYQPPFH